MLTTGPVQGFQRQTLRSGRTPVGRVGIAAFGVFIKPDKAVEDAEPKLELAAIDKRLPLCLDVVQVRELKSQENEVKQDDQDVDADQVIQNSKIALVAHSFLELKKSSSLLDIES